MCVCVSLCGCVYTINKYRRAVDEEFPHSLLQANPLLKQCLVINKEVGEDAALRHWVIEHIAVKLTC